MYANLNEVENFNHKHAGTLMYSEMLSKWIMIEHLDGGYLQYRIPEKGVASKRMATHVRDLPPKLLKKAPEISFYNDFSRGEALYVRRNPRRTARHTITLESIDATYPFWDNLPKALRSELMNTLPHSCSNLNSFGVLLNNNKLLSFRDAVTSLEDGEMASCAFDANFMVSLSPTKKEDGGNNYLLWYTHIPVGYITKKDERVVVEKMFLLQEVKDILRGQNCKWVVVA